LKNYAAFELKVSFHVDNYFILSPRKGRYDEFSRNKMTNFEYGKKCPLFLSMWDKRKLSPLFKP